MSKLLIPDHPLQVLPKLALLIGLNEAIVLQQIHYWIEHAKKTLGNEESHFREGRWWTWNTVAEWQGQFPFWSEATVRRILYSLRERGLIIAKGLCANPYDKTLWYAIDYDALEKLEKNPCAQDDSIGTGGMNESNNVSEISSETSFPALNNSSNDDRAGTLLDVSHETSREEILSVAEEMLDPDSSCSNDNSSATEIPVVAKTTSSSHNSSATGNPIVAATHSPYCNPLPPPTERSAAKGRLGFPNTSVARLDIMSEPEYVPCDEDGDVPPPKKKRRGRPRTQLGKLPIAEILESPRRAELFPGMADDEMVDEIARLANWFVRKRMSQLTHHPVVAWAKETVFAQKLFSYYSPIEVVSCFKKHYDDKNGLLNVWWNIKQFIQREFKLPVDPRTLDDWKRWPPHVQDKQLEEYREQTKEARVPWRANEQE